jgi:hypothetical protein
MKDKKLEIGINEIKRVSMTDSEKNDVYRNIMSFSARVKSVQSPWFAFSFSIVSSRSRLVYYIVVPLIIILSSGSVVFASQDSLPDSILYPLKVKIVEPIKGVLSFSQKSKAIHESGLAKKRLLEAETLAKGGKLDVKNEKKISTLLTTHTISLNNALDKVNTSESPEVADEISTNFRAEMNAHAKVLDIIIKREEPKKDIETGDNSKNDNVKISNTARISAEKIKKTSNKIEKNNFKKYKEKKEEIKSLIETTDKNIDLNLNREDEDEREPRVVSNTYETIDQAKASLDNADIKDLAGDLEEAYSSLLDSESLIKEANILSGGKGDND